jgi:hypothetical protein
MHSITVILDGKAETFQCLKSLLSFRLSEYLNGDYKSLEIWIDKDPVEKRQMSLTGVGV